MPSPALVERTATPGARGLATRYSGDNRVPYRGGMSSRLLLPALLGAITVVSATQSAAPPAPPVSCAAVTAANADDCLRLNHLQVLGTHNSYHLAPAAPILAALGDRAPALDYTHQPLPVQLERLGIRQLEIDVYADPSGGRYSTPAMLRTTPGLERLVPGPALRAPGFKVLHVPDVDFHVTCPTLVACLTEVRDWSRAHPRHVPILVMLELKDEPRDDPRHIGLVQPLPIDGPALDALDAEIRSVFDETHLLTPDDVRGSRATLREALEKDGWPRLRDARGKVLFAMDNTDAHRAAYLDGHPTLERRVLFVSADPGSPASAFLKMNDALGAEGRRIRARVAETYIVRTRADEPGKEARTGDTRRRDAAFATGAQFVSTDYPEPSPFGTGYLARLPGAASLPARCNPVTAPPGCRDAWLEALR
ncbi:phosphatidylinositol-specific phospholipase C1-like protein [Luteitalea pratensis]|uniref:phosphatidylinositol-specific phospholipase C1-like protein n=1 Tax=Luteitalea pratensis TaxID=1855912 RepID=UPI001F44FFF5|nr:phosphatidylinositol-specific phospholipase C1-like protein [Luteitalea pratensis]